MSEFPISCLRCRRRKIKCNKRKPCNQCIKQAVPCQFPSKFRNISIEEALRTEKEYRNSITPGPMDHSSPTSSEVCKLEEQVRKLEMKIQYMKDNFNRKIREEIEKNEEELSARSQTNAFEISGETTENGEKYYGPMSSNNMTEDLDILSNRKGSTTPLKHHSWTASPFKIAEDDHHSSRSSSTLSADFSQKEPMPWIVDWNESPEGNLHAIKRLVKEFFVTKTYDFFITETKVLQFTEDYASIPELSWEGTDDLLLLHMILILSMQRTSPISYNNIFRSSIRNYSQLWEAIKPTQRRLFRQYSKLRHNLVNESYVTIQAYILCAEWEFLEQRYEESWSMMFHCCSIAYALGLHVVAKSSSLSLGIDPDPELDHGRKLKDGYDDFYLDELPKLRVWFGLRNFSSQLCSILGRPNPIIKLVNSVSLPLANITKVKDAEAFNSLINTQLKSGLSECIRISNSSIIERFLQKVSLNNVWCINQQFTQEINKLSYYLNNGCSIVVDGAVKQINPLTSMPATITRRDVLKDLVLLHVNRVKLLQPFIDMSPPNESALKFIMGSILLFYEHTCELVCKFVERETTHILDLGEANEDHIPLDKVCIYRNPFFTSFVYQGIVLTFILMNVKAKDFIQNNNGDFISQVERQVQVLLGLQSSITNIVKERIHLWSPKHVYLMEKILGQISMMKQAVKDRSGGQTYPSFSGFENDPQITEMLGNNLKDPFWVINPEHSPNYLGVSDRYHMQSASGNGGTGIVMNQPPVGKMPVSNYPRYNDTSRSKMEGLHLHGDTSTSLFSHDSLIESPRSQFVHMGGQIDFADPMKIESDDLTTPFVDNTDLLS